MTINYNDELNESQREAVYYCDGPSLVIAGAGSGKTRVLTYKIAYLIESGLEPWNILALTFTNKAAREMKSRIAQKVGSHLSHQVWMGTFHSIFARILRYESDAIGFTSNFTIYDTADSKSLLKSIIREMGLDEKVYKVNTVLNHISNAKNHLVSPDGYAKNREARSADENLNVGEVYKIYAKYWSRCRHAGAMDFDDLLVYTYLLFRDHPDILDKYAERFKYVLVDEYQDTNYAQHRIVMQLTEKNQKICVVGDDAQSIYSFRGADIDNILHFPDSFSGAKVFKLEQNYRSTKNIVSAANSLIHKNRNQIFKEVFSENETGEIIHLFKAYSDFEEGEIVVNELQKLRRKEDFNYADFAILYRTNAQSRIFEEALRKRMIPYKIYGGLSFYQRKEVKDAIAYFRLIINPDDEEALKRIINYPTRGIGNVTLNKIISSAIENETSLWNVVCDPIAYNLAINKGTHTKLQKFKDLIQSFIAKYPTENAFELGQTIIKEAGLMSETFADNSPENLSRRENLEELVNGMQEFCLSREEQGIQEISLADFLSEVSLLTDQDNEKEEDFNKVTLMTIHSAKGLEFPNVFIVGLEEQLFPSFMSMDSPRGLEEERRLFYVAITRAEKNCFISYASSRYKFGKTEFSNPSRFLRDIDEKFIVSNLTKATSTRGREDSNAERIQEKMRKLRIENMNRTKSSSSPKLAPPSNMVRVRKSASSANSSLPNGVSLSVGQRIEHERFGLGEVIAIQGSGENAKATVSFENSGQKQLLLRFARFKILG